MKKVKAENNINNIQDRLPVKVAGEVIRGLGKGKKMGIATANLKMDDLKDQLDDLIFGVYACSIKIRDSVDHESKSYPAAIHYGPRLVFEEDDPQFEIHILDFDDEIYQKTLEVTLLHYLRPTMQFPNTDTMVIQIKLDVERTRVVFNLNDASSKS